MYMEPTLEQMTGSGESGQQLISLVIPCRPEYIGLCRLVAGVVGARESLDEELIADLKLVVTEACTCFIWGADGGPSTDLVLDLPDSLRVDFNVAPDLWEITVSDPEGRRPVIRRDRFDAMSERALGLTIINALVDSMEEIEGESGGTVLRLVKRLSPGLGAVV
jgi:anti-sigma regulatory factor (Ser/Thr protein kinase)